MMGRGLGKEEPRRTKCQDASAASENLDFRRTTESMHASMRRRVALRLSVQRALLGKFLGVMAVGHDVRKNGAQHDYRRLGRIDGDGEILTVVIEERFGFALIGLEAMANDFLIGIVEAVVLDGALFQAGDKLVP